MNEEMKNNFVNYVKETFTLKNMFSVWMYCVLFFGMLVMFVTLLATEFFSAFIFAFVMLIFFVQFKLKLEVRRS